MLDMVSRSRCERKCVLVESCSTLCLISKALISWNILKERRVPEALS